MRAAARKKYNSIENERSSSTINVTSSIYDPKIRKTKTKTKHMARKNCENNDNSKSVSFANDVTQSESVCSVN